MSEVCGKLVTCDRCGETVFLKVTGEKVADGGFTRWNTFEAFPEGWEWHHEPGRLCPKCNEEYKKLLKDFLEPPVEVCRLANVNHNT